jgi:hypothetical protein
VPSERSDLFGCHDEGIARIGVAEGDQAVVRILIPNSCPERVIGGLIVAEATGIAVFKE